MKITFKNLRSGFRSVLSLNSNFQKIADAFQNKILFRDNPEGEPNSMQQSLDMNGNDVLGARAVYANAFVAIGTDDTPPTTSNLSGLYTKDTLISIGPTGDYESYSAALKEVTKSRAVEGVSVRLRAQPGFVLGEQLHFNFGDYSWIVIESEDTVMPIDINAFPSVLSTTVDGTAYAGMLAGEYCVMPRLGTTIDLGNQGSSFITGIVLGSSSKMFSELSGCINSTGKGLVVGDGAEFVGLSTEFTSQDESVLCTAGGSAVITSSTLSSVNTNEITVLRGGIVNAHGTTGVGNIADNTFTANGVIFREV